MPPPGSGFSTRAKKAVHMTPPANLLPLLRCPSCHSQQLTLARRDITCLNCDARYPLLDNRPVMLRRDNPVFRPDDYVRSDAHDGPASSAKWRRFIPTPSLNLARERVLGSLRDTLPEDAPSAILVVGCGQQRNWLEQWAGERAIRMVYTDVDINADVDLFCDGHELPFADGVFDAVITSAVLEHVLDPNRVVSEICRVLAPGGLLYSEIPFMQQVHEGAFDFTRYTLSGHRRLLNNFAEIESGMVAGPATALVWAIENFALAFLTRSSARNIAKAAVRLGFSWIKHFDRLLANRAEAMDGASCTYFLGRRSEARMSDREVIARYVGAGRPRHT